MHLHSYLGWEGPVTNRQHDAWVVWLDMQWELPDRHDHYLMQLHAEVRRLLAKHPQSVKVEDSKIKFTKQDPKTLQRKKWTPEQRMNVSKAMWFGAVGMKPTEAFK